MLPVAGDAQDLWQRQTLAGDWGGLRTRLENSGVTFALQQQTELWSNAKGGFGQGGAADGLLTASLAVDLDKAVGWRGGKLFASLYQIEGVGPTPLRVGALQDVSSFEATESTKLFDLWFEQELLGGKFSLRFGQEGADDELMLSQYAALYFNASFGFPPLLALDLPSGGPAYPLATPFVRARYQPSGEVTVIGAVYSGDPAPSGAGDPELRDRHGTAFRLNDHTLSFAELWYAPKLLASVGAPATYKLGAWVATGSFADRLHDTIGLSLADPASAGLPLQHASDHGFYAVIDQTLWKTPETGNEEIGAFLLAMLAPADRNLSDLFIAGGIDWKGPIASRPDDTAGLAVSFAR
ncbi:MAG: carbohydrate porin, partial [Stellaceae bacterium]